MMPHELRFAQNGGYVRASTMDDGHAK